MDSSLEIRKLNSSQLGELVHILEQNEYWKRLMTIIPKILYKDTYECDITITNLRRYNSEHFRLVENASRQYNSSCTEILFDDWGTSGKVRPALGHLLYLLIKAELFRAADYVATLLNLPPPQRPSSGPAAAITTDLSATYARENRGNENNVEELLDKIDHVSSALEEIRRYSLEPHTPVHLPANPPEIVISEVSDNLDYDFGAHIVLQREKVKEEANSDMIEFSKDISEDTDMMKFSYEISSTNNVPLLTDLLNNSSTVPALSENNEYTPAFTEIMNQSCTVPHFTELLIGDSEVSSRNVPSFDDLNIMSDSSIDDTTSEQPITYSETENIPNISELNNTASQKTVAPSEANMPHLSLIMGGTESHTNTSNLPDFCTLQTRSKNSVNYSSQLSYNSNSRNTLNTSAKCSSPLPNLSLNTLLPHFTYRELELSTNGFSSEPFTTEDSSGRFLGSGAFGAVFLAKGLLDRPVAVKKLLLENVEEVNVDDRVTKQFKNEVEVLSKYKHDNLLPLLGYSCDGCTYCLLYEYMPGGTLRDRLAISDSQHKLQWKDRFKIAVGTAKAVSYLHTAFSTPLIHRDIKSANILLDSSNNAKLCDFGLIKLLPSQNTHTQTTVHGTSAYMSPEAHRGDISVKLDTFSFGVVLLELLTSLVPLDPDRDGCDLVTHVEDTCENSGIEPLLDKTAGSWEENCINVSDKLFKISLQCLEEKKKRPNMVEVTQVLEDIFKKI